MKIFLKTMFGFDLNNEFPDIEFTDDVEDFPDVEVIITNNLSLTAPETIDQCGKLKYFQSVIAGYDKIDLTCVKEKGIRFCRCSSYGAAISEDIIFRMLYFSRRYDAYTKSQRERVWCNPYKVPNICELRNKTVGILGTGNIATETAKRLQAFGMTILGYRRSAGETPFFDTVYRGDDGLDEMIRLSDFLVIALPLSSETIGLIDRRRLGIAKRNCILINIARGKIIQEEALIDALREGDIRAAALDVFSIEPLPEDSPLWDMENVLITPHGSGITDLTIASVKSLVCENLRRYIAGEELLCVVV